MSTRTVRICRRWLLSKTPKQLLAKTSALSIMHYYFKLAMPNLISTFEVELSCEAVAGNIKYYFVAYEGKSKFKRIEYKMEINKESFDELDYFRTHSISSIEYLYNVNESEYLSKLTDPNDFDGTFLTVFTKDFEKEEDAEKYELPEEIKKDAITEIDIYNSSIYSSSSYCD